MEKVKAEALLVVMDMSAMQRSAVPSMTSPNIPLHTPGESSSPYRDPRPFGLTSLIVKLQWSFAASSAAKSIANPSNRALPSSFLVFSTSMVYGGVRMVVMTKVLLDIASILAFSPSTFVSLDRLSLSKLFQVPIFSSPSACSSIRSSTN